MLSFDQLWSIWYVKQLASHPIPAVSFVIDDELKTNARPRQSVKNSQGKAETIISYLYHVIFLSWRWNWDRFQALERSTF